LLPLYVFADTDQGTTIWCRLLVCRWAVLDGCLGMWALKPRLLVFDAINFPALWTCGQDDELVIDNQGFWFPRSCEELPEY
jgi:hypothetical protein